MRIKSLWILLLSCVLSLGAMAQSGDQSPKQDIKDAGHDTKNAVKKTARGVKHGTKKVVHKSAHATRKGAGKVEDKTSSPPQH
ncbi:MAG TPA: hypothetical protein VKT33_13725 [Candidatus Angelobacter sp.]|nr:hypothetical protein [Candidatus Angelobacter sp.]